jgi:hypothetical protein
MLDRERGWTLPEIANVRYTHDAVIDEILRNPAISQGELSRMFGFSQAWMSICINSDAFQERLAERKAILTDPKIIASINERLDAVAKRSLDKILDRLDSPTALLKTLELVAIAKLGVGDKNTRPAGPVAQNNLYVVALPAPAADSTEWISQVKGKLPLPSNPPGAIEEAVLINRG